jgi:hypothetical protein
MPLLNAEEDFAQRTLGTLQNVWEKLAYVSGLKSSEGSYDHWGLASVHGREVASQAIAKAHSEVLRETLATPLQKLHTFERNSAISAEKKPHLFMPADLRGGCREHVEYVVEALRLLGQRESQTSHQAA